MKKLTEDEIREAKLGFPLRTPNPDCPTCLKGGIHTTEEFKMYHPQAGHGIHAAMAQPIKSTLNNEPR